MITSAGAARPGVSPPAVLASEQDAEQEARGRLWRALAAQYPPRPCAAVWEETTRTRAQVTARLTAAPFSLPGLEGQRQRDRGLDRILDWLQAQSGGTWQERWAAGGAEAPGVADWRSVVARWLKDTGRMSPGRKRAGQAIGGGPLPLVCGDVLRPGLRWLMTTRTLRDAAAEMGRARDPGGFALLAAVCRADPASRDTQRVALRHIAVIMAAKGGMAADITAGDCLELLSLGGEIDDRHPRSPHFYQLLHTAGMLPAAASPTVRAFRAGGQRSAGQLIDCYAIECQPVRDLLVNYLRERRLGVDYATLRGIAHTLGKLFWRDVELHHPGISSLRLPGAVAVAWRERLLTKTIRSRTTSGGDITETLASRSEVHNHLTRVRAFYPDIAEWAADDPARWGPWAAPCPVRPEQLARGKHLAQRKARMDQRTRERMPVLPLLIAATLRASRDAGERLAAAGKTRPGEMFTAGGQALRRPVLTSADSARIWAEDPSTGRRRDLTLEEHRAFWMQVQPDEAMSRLGSAKDAAARALAPFAVRDHGR